MDAAGQNWTGSQRPWRPESGAWGARSQEVTSCRGRCGREDAGAAAARPRPSGSVTRGACKASLPDGPGASTEAVWGRVSEHACSQRTPVTILVTTMGGQGDHPTALRSQFRFRDVNCGSRGTQGGVVSRGWGWAHRTPGPTWFHITTRRHRLRWLITSESHRDAIQTPSLSSCCRMGSLS